MREIVRTAIVEHSAARLYALVDDVAAYPLFLPWCRAAQVRERTGSQTVATLEIGMGPITQSLTTRNENQPPHAIRIALVEGPFRHFEALWRFSSLGEQAAKIEFRLAYDFSSRGAAAALGPLFGQIADTMVDAFTRRADALHADDPR